MSAETPLTLQDDGSLSFMDLIVLMPVEGGLDVTMTGTTEHLVALEKPDGSGFAAIAGDWHSNEIGVTLNIADNGRMRTAGKYGSANYALEAIGPHIWSAIHPVRGGSATLQHADCDLFLSSLRSIKMRFSRI
jgi:hypothetical protein